ncbi:MAG: phosphotransferase [Oscillospiraceae bacterium]|nr:phosphotransferase [Oscillospiraceae bacterium]
MERGQFEKEVKSEEIRSIASKILGAENVGGIFRICERYGEDAGDVREYDVYRVNTPFGDRMLKKAAKREAENYARYLAGKSLRVPACFGRSRVGRDDWIALERIDGEDLRDMTDALAIAAADSIAEIQNCFWGSADTDRFDAYLERIRRRYSFIKDDPPIGEAYRLFLERQKTCPRTLSNGDFLEFNALSRAGAVYIVDWGFGGVMPYSLDIARFIAHATEDRATFPFYMNVRQKKLFVNGVYERLNDKPDYERYLLDIKLAVLNEYVEFVEADEDDERWYYEHAKALAEELLSR